MYWLLSNSIFPFYWCCWMFQMFMCFLFYFYFFQRKQISRRRRRKSTHKSSFCKLYMGLRGTIHGHSRSVWHCICCDFNLLRCWCEYSNTLCRFIYSISLYGISVFRIVPYWNFNFNPHPFCFSCLLVTTFNYMDFICFVLWATWENVHSFVTRVWLSWGYPVRLTGR